MSASAVVTLAPPLKSSAGNPGTPPSGSVRQSICGLPLPSLWSDSTISDGLPLGSVIDSTVPPENTPSLPGLRFAVPTPPSTTRRNWPTWRRKTGRPCGSTSGVGVGVNMQENSQQNGQPSWLTGPAKRTTGPVWALAMRRRHQQDEQKLADRTHGSKVPPDWAARLKRAASLAC